VALRGETIGTAYIRILASGDDLDKSFRKELKDAEPEFRQAGKQASKSWKKGWDEENEKKQPNLLRLRGILAKEAGKFDAIGHLLGSNVLDGLDDEFKSRHGEQVGERLSQRLRDSIVTSMDTNAVEKFVRDINKHVVSAVQDIEREQKAVRDSGRETERGLSRLATALDHTGDRVGALFGRGSRNDFVNFFGALVRGPFAAVAGMVRGIARYGESIAKSFTDAGGGLTGFGKAAGTAALPLAELGGAAAALAIILGPLAGGIAGIAGAIVALASSVASALAAGFGVFVGLFPILAAGVGATILAFKGLDTKKLKTEFAGVGDELGKLEKTLGGGLTRGLSALADPLERLFKMLNQPQIAKPISDAIEGFFRQLARLVNSAEFRGFVRTVAHELPDFMTAFGDIAVRTIRGFMGLFQSALPITREFVGWLAGGAQSFADWANSDTGGLTDFFNRAGHAAKVVWDFVTKLSQALGTLLFNKDVQNAGNELFAGMTGALEDFINFLKQNPDTVKKWFGDAVDIGQAIGGVILKILDFFDALDTPETRKLAEDIFGAIGVAVQSLGNVFRNLAPVWGLLELAFKALAPFLLLTLKQMELLSKVIGTIANVILHPIKSLKELGKWFVKVFDGSGDLAKKAGDFIKERYEKAFDKLRAGLRNVGDFFQRLYNTVKKWTGNAVDFIGERYSKAWSKLRDGISNVGQWFKDRWNGLRDKAGDVASFIGERYSNAWSKLRDGVSSIAQWFKDRFGAIRDYISDIPDKISKLANSFLQAGKDLGSAIIDGIGEGLSKSADFVGDLASSVAEAFQQVMHDLVDQLNQAIPNSIDVPHGPDIPLPDNPIPNPFAAGGIVSSPTFSMLGEAGTEAVVPLGRPLALVDPAVRELAAIAQSRAMGSLGTTMDRSRTVDVGGITIVTPTEDPEAVARETINQLVASTYF
jgi:phage-related protein